MQSSASGDFSGLASSTAYFQPEQWFSSTSGMTLSDVSSSGSSSVSGSGSSSSESYSDSEGEADIPIFVPVPFEELSSVQYYTLEEQLTEATAALKQQFPRHCFIKLPGAGHAAAAGAVCEIVFHIAGEFMRLVHRPTASEARRSAGRGSGSLARNAGS